MRGFIFLARFSWFGNVTKVLPHSMSVQRKCKDNEFEYWLWVMANWFVIRFFFCVLLLAYFYFLILENVQRRNMTRERSIQMWRNLFPNQFDCKALSSTKTSIRGTNAVEYLRSYSRTIDSCCLLIFDARYFSLCNFAESHIP